MTHAVPWTSRNGIRKNIPASTTRKTHPQGAPTSAKPLETTITKVIHTMLPIDPSSTANMRTPLEALIASTFASYLLAGHGDCISPALIVDKEKKGGKKKEGPSNILFDDKATRLWD